MYWIIFFCVFPAMAFAQGFAGLGSQADGFAVPQRGYELTFPRDHGPHPEFRIEWWYLTANLADAQGRLYGLQWTLFRSALAPQTQAGWNSAQIWMGHAAVTTPADHFVAERLGRGGIGQAGVAQGADFTAWIDDWYMRGDADLQSLALRAAGLGFSYDMQLRAHGPLVLQGDKGYSVKSDAGQASYYYSQPFFDIAGVLSLPEGDVQVSGSAWLDREWSSQPLAREQTGWDWFSLSFENGAKMMGFALRAKETTAFTSATWIEADGTATPLPAGALQARALEITDVNGRNVPTRWALRLPAKNLDVVVDALNPQAWMETSVPYWEGPIAIEGSHSGLGYLEMTGY